MNPIMLHEVGKARQHDILNEARHQHTVAGAESAHPGRAALLLDRLGRLMIAAGGFLQRPAARQRRPAALHREWGDSNP